MDDDRLIRTSDLQLEREMLQVAAEETAPADVRRRALASLGLLVIASPGATVSMGANGGASALGKSPWLAWLPKAAVVVGIGGSAIVAGTAWMQGRGEVPATSAKARAQASGQNQVSTPHESLSAGVGDEVPLPVQSQGAAVAEPPAPPATVAPRSAAAASARRAEQAAAAPWLAPSIKAPTPVPAISARSEPAPAPNSAGEVRQAASIREEIDLLDRARSELRRGRASLALAVTNEYFARYPRGELRAEAEVVRREARQASSSSAP